LETLGTSPAGTSGGDQGFHHLMGFGEALDPDRIVAVDKDGVAE
jgi:hypothetical protein